MISLDELLQQVWSQAKPVHGTESVSVLKASGRVLAQDMTASLHVPSYDNSSMDGYALFVEPDSPSPQLVSEKLPVSQRIPAGSQAQPLQAGTCARIFTGAPIPPGANAVVMQEDVTVLDDGSIQVNAPVSVGQWIRPVGDDIRRGDVILAKGTRLDAAHLGLLASIGIAEVTVARRLKVGVLFTGSELQSPGQPLRPGKIYNSNRSMWYGLLSALPCDIEDAGDVEDTLAATRLALQRLKHCDLILSSGGVSVGEEDHVKKAVELEGQLQSWKVAMKPGKPLAFGRVGEAWFAGLPGNPVSSFAVFALVVRPFLMQLAGQLMPQVDWRLRMRSLKANFAWPKPDRRLEMARARINSDGALELFRNQSSGVLTSVAWADGFAVLKPDTTVQPGEFVHYVSFNDLLS